MTVELDVLQDELVVTVVDEEVAVAKEAEDVTVALAVAGFNDPPRHNSTQTNRAEYTYQMG